MKKYKSILKLFVFVLLLTLVISYSSFAAYPPVRVKDIAHVLVARENQLMGFGLVVGLKRTGDSAQTGFTEQALTNLLNRLGVTPQEVDFKSRNVASVMVTANIPPFIKSGQKLDVVVSSVGDASSIKGGTLLQTPLVGADNKVYAVAQGQVIISDGMGGESYPSIKRAHTTSGRIPSGGLVEKEIPVKFDETALNIVLDNPDFTTAVRLADTIKNIGYDARAVDGATVVVPVFEGEDTIKIISEIELATLVPDVVAKVVINEKTGIIVIGENVRMAPVAVAYKGFSVTIGTVGFSASGVESEGGIEEETSTDFSGRIEGERDVVKIVGGTTSISDLVAALNALGATPKDLIAILESIKRSGALPAEIDVIS